MKVNLGPTLKGECTVGVKLEDFVNARTNHYESVIEYDGVAVIAPVRELAHSPLSPASHSREHRRRPIAASFLLLTFAQIAAWLRPPYLWVQTGGRPSSAHPAARTSPSPFAAR